MKNLTFAFFPLFPLLINTFLRIIPNLQIAAFIVTNLLLLLNFVSLYLIISKLSGKSVAAKTCWLIFLFPFSVFFRSYFSENLQLLLSLWFLYFLIGKRFLIASIFFSLLSLTKGIILPFGPVFLFELLRNFRKRRLSGLEFTAAATISGLGIGSWYFYNYLLTGHPSFFQSVQSAWYFKFPVPPPVYNLALVINFFRLPLHAMHSSQIDVILLLLFLFLLIWSRKHLPPLLWLYSLLLWTVPFFTRDLTSFGRYQSVSFPIFYALAARLPGSVYFPLLFLFSAGLLVVSLYFANWYWIG